MEEENFPIILMKKHLNVDSHMLLVITMSILERLDNAVLPAVTVRLTFLVSGYCKQSFVFKGMVTGFGLS